jgi:hypothetical protein
MMLAYLSFSPSIARAARIVSVLLVLAVIDQLCLGAQVNGYLVAVLLAALFLCMDWIVIAMRATFRAVRALVRAVA